MTPAEHPQTRPPTPPRDRKGLTGLAPTDLGDPVARAARYQRQRLWCGVLGIGAVLGLLWLCAWGGFGETLGRWFGGLHPAVGGAMAAALLGVMVSVVQAPFDLFAGRVVEGNARQIDVDARYDWGRAYGLGVMRWIAALAGGGAAVGWAWSAAPETWPVLAGAAVVGLSLMQLALPIAPGPVAYAGSPRRPWLDRVKAELEKRGLKLPRVGFYEHGERSLAGGWSGFGPTRKLWLARTIWDVDPTTAAALIARELTHLKEGHRALSVMGTAVWVVAGLVITSLLPHGKTAPGVVFAVAVVMSTWCWVSLLFVWPAVGRWMVYAADRGMLEAGFTKDESLAALASLSERNKPDDRLPEWVEFVFHPIPPMGRRRSKVAGCDLPMRSVEASRVVNNPEEA